MPYVTFEYENKKVEVNAGVNLRDVAQANNVSLYSGIWKTLNCRGNGLCCKCLVEVDRGSDNRALSQRTRMEEVQLKDQPLTRRLACQVVVHGDVVVKTHPRG